MNLNRYRKQKPAIFILFRSLASKPLRKNTSSSYLYQEDHQVVDGLLSIFTKNPSLLLPLSRNPELQALAFKLTPKIVESTVNQFHSWKKALTFFTWVSNQDKNVQNCYTYSSMAAVLSSVRQNVPLKNLAYDMVNDNVKMTAGALGFFVRCFARLGMVEEANAWFERVTRSGLCVPNSYSYNCLLEAICKDSKYVDLLEDRYKEMQVQGLRISSHTLTPLLQGYCNAGKFEEAMRVFSEIREKGWVDAYVCSILVLSFSKWGYVDRALELVEMTEECDIGLTEKTFYVLIHGFVKQCRFDEALVMFHKMRKSGFSPDLSLYDVLIGGFCKNNDIEKALCLYRDMQLSGISPDVGILMKLVSSFSGEEEILRVLENTEDNVEPRAMIFLSNAVLNALVNGSSIDKAYHLLQAMMRENCGGDVGIDKLFRRLQFVQPDTTSFNIVIQALCKSGDLDRALSLFKSMDNIGCEKDVFIYNNLIDGLCNSNRLEESYELLDMMKVRLKPSQFTHNSLFGCLCRRGDVDGALDLVKVMRVQGHVPWIKHTALLVKQLCTHTKAAKACQFLDYMLQSGFPPDVVAYSAAISALISVQKLDQAQELFQKICALGYIPDVVAYNVLINGLCKAKRISEAESLLNEMLEKGLIPSTVTYNLLIDGWCKNGEIDTALLCIPTMLEKEREPNIITYTTLVDGLCKAGRPDDALILWNDMEKKGCTPNAVSLMALIFGLCKCDRPETALAFFHQMEEKEMEPDIFVYLALIDALVSNTNLVMAYEMLQKLVQKGKFPDPLDKNYLVLRKNIATLYRDPTTSSRIDKLIAEGRIPTVSSVDIENDTSTKDAG